MMQPPSTTGLARFRSAPATWLDALLESVTDEDEAFLPPTPLPPRSQAVFETSSGGGIFRQNSLPVDFVASGSDSYFDGYEVVAGGGVGGVGLNYDFAPSPSSTSSSKRLREQGFLEDSDKFSSQLKEEDQSEHLERGLSGILDPEMEKIFEDSVPCRVRAKRGCATHPRSIAERVRRTRISDRIRKLQELVPNMEKQTNTADMLEEAVEYVKFLQKQIQELTEQQKNCKCVEKEQ